jgi:hypothetical protein
MDHGAAHRARPRRAGGPGAFAAFAESAKGTAGRAEEARRRAEVALSAAVEERLGGELRARLEGN